MRTGRPVGTWHYSDDEQRMLAAVRAHLVEAFRERGINAFARHAGLPVTTVQRVWWGTNPQRKTLERLYAACTSPREETTTC